MRTPRPLSDLPARLVRLYPRWMRQPTPSYLETQLRAILEARRRKGPLASTFFVARTLVDALSVRFTRSPARTGSSRRRPEMSSIWQDLRFTARTLRNRPLFVAAAVLTLGLGIGANSLIFSVAESALLRPLPYASPQRLVTVWSQWVDFEKTWVSQAEYALYRDGVGSFEDVAAFGQFTVTASGGGAPERLGAASVTSNLLEVLGLEPAAGRGFTAEEASTAADVVLLGHELWQRRYGGGLEVLGTAIEIEGTRQTVVGILPAGLELPQDLARGRRSQIWFPMREPGPFAGLPPNGGSHGWLAVARLAPGASLGEARAELEEHNRRWTESGAYSEGWNFRTRIFPVEEEATGSVAGVLRLLGAAVVLLLLIACANLASLSLSRLMRRRRELAIRAALGAGRARISRLVLAESLLLSLGGGLLGLGFAAGGLQLLQALAADRIPRLDQAGLNPKVIGFTLAVSIAAALVCGVFPAFWAAGRRAGESLRSAASGLTSHPWARGFTVASQVALAVVLVTGTGLMLRTVQQLLAIDPGFDRRGVAAFDLDLPQAHYPEAEAVTAFYRRAVERLAEEPGVAAAGAVRRLPLATEMGDWGVQVEGYTPEPGEQPAAEWQSATPGYFEAMGIRLLEGRTFSAADDPSAPPVMVVNRSFARKYWPDGKALGRKVRIGGSGDRPWTTVVGVVADVVHNGLTSQAKPSWYLPQEQFHLSTGFASRGMTVVLRSQGAAPPSSAAVTAAVGELDPRLAVSNLRSLKEVVGSSIAPSRLATLLLVGFSTLAVLLAVVGIFGVTAAGVEQRRREMSIRISLGARPRQAVGLILAQGSVPIGLGLAVGVLVSVLATRLLANLLYGVGSLDPLTFSVAPLLLAAAGLLASYVPARRAARADPRAVLQEG